MIITIIVLIILAGITISIALGNNGIFKKSQKAVDEYQKQAKAEQEQLDKAFINMGVEPLNVNELTIGKAQNVDKYGWKVEDYNVEKEETGGWRLFYQDNKCTYLISDNLIYEEGKSGYIPINYYTDKYSSGADVSIVGQKLSPMLTGTVKESSKNFFVGNNTNPNFLATAWFTDPSQWSKYKNNDAEFAIGSPTVELYAASFDATAEYENKSIQNNEDKRNTIKELLGVGKYGYTENTSGQLSNDYNKGIYNKDEEDWWLASPGCSDDDYDICGLGVSGKNHYFCSSSVNERDGMPNRAIRPIVCIQTSVFEAKYESTLKDI